MNDLCVGLEVVVRLYHQQELVMKICILHFGFLEIILCIYAVMVKSLYTSGSLSYI